MIINLKRFNLLLFSKLVFVDADNHCLALVDAGLLLRSGPLNRGLRRACADIGRHAASLINVGDDRLSLLDQLRGQSLDIMRAAQGIDHIGDAAFFLQNKLSVARNPCREIGRQGNRFV